MQITQTQPVDTRPLRDALGRFATGVGIVTARDASGAPVGMTINSFTSISLTPPLVAWCIDRRAAGFAAFSQSATFAVTLLGETQQALARRFATRGEDKFRGLDTSGAEAPLIPDGCAWFRCDRSVDLGDHRMLIGRITAFGSDDVPPLTFQGGCFGQLAEPCARRAA